MTPRLRGTGVLGFEFDFSRSLPPTPDGLDEAISEGLRAVAQGDLATLIRASTARGGEPDRLAAATWLGSRLGASLDHERIFMANGTQSAVLLLLQALVPPGKRLVAERLSYGMLRNLCEIARVPVTGLGIDTDGLCPAELETACGAGDVGAIYCNPTFHNPTATVMSQGRRREILEIAARFGVPIVEDDPLGVLYPEALPPPLATLAPEQVWHVCGLTKSIAQGLRVAYVVAPTPAARDRFLGGVERLSHWVAAPVSLALATWLVQSGRGATLRAAIADENLSRERAARLILPAGLVEGAAGSPHLWIPLPVAIERQLTDELERDGVQVRGEELFRVDDSGEAPTGIRLSLSSPRERSHVLAGLERIRQHLERALPELAPTRPRKEAR